ncbi:choline/carnitine/betaine transport [Amycolatopsis marina]|uniref:Choline/carnitine/betaine transport n=1 Tax=Amycolatopsis marina TaxID=490629 RepID=A0A1I0XBI1_9PSEU|nr:BCCT family transporter [Amycolatopsis marina]SFA97776.1 choline/carnitine/betaine transport [Amycolatopsis marina]
MADATEKPRIDRVVFGISLGLIIAFCVVGAIFPVGVGEVGSAILSWLVADLGWIYVLAATGFVVFAFWLVLSKYGRIPLSRDNEPPEFSTSSWIAMMFSAGMGIGLIFFGVAEPIAHLTEPAPGLDVAPSSEEATRHSMAYTFFHWGLHPWAIYAVVALALAYSTFRKGRGNLISSPFQSLVRDKEVEYTWWGRFVNIWSIVATKFGGATSLGLGALQIAGGLALVTDLGGGFTEGRGSKGAAFFVIFVLVTLAIISAISGVSRGIKWLSNTNMVLAALLLLFVLIVGPTVFIFDLIPASIGAYLSNLVPMSFSVPLFGGTEWFSSWTIFYWAWWISWTPFVSTFIARISRGRTVREFVAGVLFVPTAVSALWFTVLGGAGLDLELSGADISGSGGTAQQFFTVLQNYPGYTATGIMVMILVAIFWISGADSSALVLATLSSHGAREPNKYLVALWAGLSAAVAAVLLYVGGLGALQTFTVIVAAPFVVVMVALCVALMVDLRRDPLRERRAGPVRRGNVPPTDEAITEAGQTDAGKNGEEKKQGTPAKPTAPPWAGEPPLPAGTSGTDTS